MINTRSQKILLTPAFPVPEGWQTRLRTRSRAGLNRPEIQTSPTTRWPPNRVDFSPTDWRRKKRAYQNGLARVPKAGNCRHSDFRTRRDLPNLHRNKTSQTSRHSSKFAISILTAASPCQSLATTCRGEQRVFSDPTCSQTRRALNARRRKPSPNPSRLAIDGHLAALRHRPSGVSAVSPLSTCQSRSIKNTQTVPAAHHGVRKPVGAYTQIRRVGFTEPCEWAMDLCFTLARAGHAGFRITWFFEPNPSGQRAPVCGRGCSVLRSLKQPPPKAALQRPSGAIDIRIRHSALPDELS
jgi:hypothetical protein